MTLDSRLLPRPTATRRPVPLADLLARALGNEASCAGGTDVLIHDVCCDSRRASPGCLFVAVSGSVADGAGFVADAVGRGAVAVAADRDIVVPNAAVLVTVPSAREAVARLAAAFFHLADIQNRGELDLVGITGTNGKSTVAFMVRSILAAAGRRAAMLGTIEYDLLSRKIAAELTTPDAVTLTRHLVEAHAAGARHGVMEVSSHSLDQRRTAGLSFSTAVFTNLSQDHLDYHGRLEDYLLAKRRLFEALDADAVAVVNADDPATQKILEGCAARVIRFGLGPTADARGLIQSETLDGGYFTLEREGTSLDLHTPLVGRHNILNALAAAATGIALGLDIASIRSGLANLAFVPGRLQRLDTGGLGFDVFVDYAHTDDALSHALGSLRPITKGRLWCVFGCGGDRDKTKRPLMARAVARGADRFVITSDNPRTEDPLDIIADIERGLPPKMRAHGITEPDRADAIAMAVENLAQGDTLLIAGKGHEDYQIVGTEKHHFDDTEVATDAIKRRHG